MKKDFILFDEEEIISPPEQQKTPQETPNTYNPIARQREAEEQQRAVYKAHQEAILKAGGLRSTITKGIQKGENPYKLLLQAIECISLMTGDKLFYSLNKEQIKLVYGVGLQEKSPLEIELSEVRERLKLLSRPEIKENEKINNKTRITTAIKRHEELEQYLINQIKETDV